jgi:class 3 adenylate cyclase
MGMSTSIGITTGTAYCGIVGSSIRQEYAAVGDVVNLSARLMCKANRGILMDEATYARLPKNLRRKMKRLPAIMVKGKDKPVVPYEYVGKRRDSSDNGDHPSGKGEQAKDDQNSSSHSNNPNGDDGESLTRCN